MQDTYRCPAAGNPARAAAGAAQPGAPAHSPAPIPAMPVADSASRARQSRTVLGLVAALAGAATLLVACHSGGSNGAAGDPSSSSGAAGQTPSGPAYAQCMRQHGVTNFPDPQGPNQNSFLITGAVTRNPHFKSASQACQSLRPQQTGGAGGAGGASQQKLLAFARCMRANGVPNFPDPPPNGALRIGPGVDPGSPAFQHAAQVCGAKTGLHLGGGQQP